MQIPEVHPLNVALRYNPPMLILHYYLGSDKSKEFAHQVKVFLQENVKAKEIVTELIREEPIYFNPNVFPREQVASLFTLSDNSWKDWCSDSLRTMANQEPG